MLKIFSWGEWWQAAQLESVKIPYQLSVPFQAILGPKFGPIPNGKTPPFFPIGPEKFPIKNAKKVRTLYFVFIATKTNDIYVFTFVDS